MNNWLLDTSALLTLRDNEEGAERVQNLLQGAARGQQKCYGCFISLMEVYYRVWKDEGEEAGYQAYLGCLKMPIEWIRESPELLERAAGIKARYPISLADAWIAASAFLTRSTLLHKDPEFEDLPGLMEERLPYK
jgi:predicted nucleic acid-binding protein